MRPMLALLVMSLAINVQPAVGQRIASRLSHVEPGAYLRVQTATDGTFLGRLVVPIADSVVLLAGEARLPIPTSSVTFLWQRGRATKPGAIVGGAAGAVGLAALGSLGCLIGRSDDGVLGNEGQFADCALLGAVAGAVTGALLGGVVGAAIPTWRRRYP